MFKEITVLDMVTASIILGKWLRPGLKRKWEIFYGGILLTKAWPYLSIHWISLASHANRQALVLIFGSVHFFATLVTEWGQLESYALYRYSWGFMYWWWNS
jgi:hypothetical protein